MGVLGALPPGLRGYVAGQDMNAQRQAQEMQGILGIQGALMRQQEMGMQKERMGMQQQEFQAQQQARQMAMQQQMEQQQRLAAFAAQLPEHERVKFAAAPMEYIKDMNKRHVVGRSLVGGDGRSIYEAPRDPTLTDIGVEGKPGITQKAFVTPDGMVTPVGGQKAPEILNPDVQAAKQRIAAAGASRTNVNVNPMRETFKDEQALRKEYADESQTYKKLSEGYAKVKGALAANPTKSAPATLAAATQFMKMLDPDSVVRESELQMALRSTGMLDRLTNLHNQVMHGGVLTPHQVEEVGKIADVVYEAANKGQQKRVQHYRDLSKQYNFDPNRVVPDLGPKPQTRQAPMPGMVQDGYRFRGGNPADPKSWEKM
jgi:hypothetical protein